MKAALLILLLSTTAACIAAPPHQQVTSATPRCIPVNEIVVRHIAGPASVTFEMISGATYRNDLVGKCDAFERLGDNAIVAVTASPDTGRLCAGDRVRIFDPVDVEATGLKSYPSCRLGEFKDMAKS